MTGKTISRLCKIILPMMFLVTCFCAEGEESIRQKFDIIMADDMEAILEGVDPEALLEKPYFDILEYVEYKEGVFIRRAVVDFYFLNTVGVKITRKYRYHKRLGLWDRYYNKYYQFTDDDGAEGNADGKD